LVYLQSISDYLLIIYLKESHNAFLKVVQLFKTNLPAAQKTPNVSGDIGNMTTTSQDILVLLIPNISAADSRLLFNLSLSSEVLSCKDNGVQKRGYKILSKLVESGKLPVDAEEILKKLDDMTDGLTPAAKKVLRH